MRARMYWVFGMFVCMGASVGCNDPSFDLNVCPRALTPALHTPTSVIAQIIGVEDQTVNMALENLPSGLSVVLDSHQGSHMRTMTVTCESAGDYGFTVVASEPMSLLSNSTTVTVHCVAEGGMVPDYSACYSYSPPTH